MSDFPKRSSDHSTCLGEGKPSGQTCRFWGLY